MPASESYNISWSPPIPPPPNLTSFNNKYVEIVNATPTSIDRVEWHWLDSELGGFDETAFELWSNNGTNWTMRSNTPDTVLNKFTLAPLNQFSIFAILAPPPTPSDGGGGGGGGLNSFNVQLYSECNYSYVNVTSGGSPVGGANVLITDLYGLPVASGQTDSNGIFGFASSCGQDLWIRVSKSGYYPESIIRSTVDCSQCVSPCPPGQQLINGTCQSPPPPPPPDCGCGYFDADLQQCVAFQCCSDADCPQGYSCVDNSCQPQGCLSNDDCQDNEYCDIPPNALVGSCKQVEGLCGYAANHTWIMYECGEEEGCPSCSRGVCENRQCVIYSIECPEQVQEGEEIVCQVSREGETCRGCEVLVKDPKQVRRTVSTDNNGELRVRGEEVGAYRFEVGGASATTEVYRIVKEKEGEMPWIQICIVLLALILLLLALWCWRRKKAEEERIKRLYKEGKISKRAMERMLEELKKKHCWERFEEKGEEEKQ